MKIPPKCPVSGCYAKTFGNVAIENLNPTFGGQSLFVIQCDQGHIIAPSLNIELRSLMEHQNSILVKILEAVESKGTV